MVASEALPFAKTGGLADVLGALPAALGRVGWDATVVLPRYRGIPAGDLVDTLTVALGGFTSEARLHRVPVADHASAILVDIPELYDREGLYYVDNVDFWDNPRRFGVLARVALDYAARAERPPSLFHCHDWHAGLLPVYLKTHYAAHPTLGGVPSVFTIHNLAYQGNFTPDWLPRLDLPWDMLGIDRLEFWGNISFLKGGIVYSDTITTVSPRYAEEIQTPEEGFGFDGILRHRAADLFGILNGIDTRVWDPQGDPHLPAPFSAEDLSGKQAAKAEVLVRYGLPADAATLGRPLIGMISRMVDQKGFDLIAELASTWPTLDATFVVLGTGEPRYQDMWQSLAAAHPDRIGAIIGFDEALAHVIEAGADMFLMPSRWEPCGLNQMYSLRYGTVPVVRGVGGLADTVRDCRPGVRGATGFVFLDYSAEALLEAVRRALAAYRDRRKWRSLQAAGMKQDHSWDRSAREYVKIYESAVARASADPPSPGASADRLRQR
jgi:starch synthase